MEYRVSISLDAQGDIRSFQAYEQRIIIRSIRTCLTRDALVETNCRKPLEPNQVGSWKLRVDIYRIFYDVEGAAVYITAVGYDE